MRTLVILILAAAACLLPPPEQTASGHYEIMPPSTRTPSMPFPPYPPDYTPGPGGSPIR